MPFARTVLPGIRIARRRRRPDDMRLIYRRLVPDVPSQNAAIAGVRSNDAADVRLQLLVPGGAFQALSTWCLHPARVVNTWNRRMLRTEPRGGIPHAIEQHEYHSDVVALGNLEELRDARPEAFRVLLPE